MQLSFDYRSVRALATAADGSPDFGRLLDALDQLTGLDLYSLSVDWYRSPTFILKAKGAKGDLLVDWSSADVLVIAAGL